MRIGGFLGLSGLVLVLAVQHCPPEKANVTIVGNPEPVWSWGTADQCDINDWPDIEPTAFRTADGNIQFWALNQHALFRSVGPTLTELKRDCSAPVFWSSPSPNPPPETFYNYVWMTTPWSDPARGQVIAYPHNEFHGWTAFPLEVYCPSAMNGSDSETSTGVLFDPDVPLVPNPSCWYPNVIAAVSQDNGTTFELVYDAANRTALVIVNPNEYIPAGGGGGKHGLQGLPHHSNIVSWKPPGSNQTYFYMLVEVNIAGAPIGTCLYRNADPFNVQGWLGWDGSSYSIQSNYSLYRTPEVTPSQHICKPVFTERNCPHWTFNTVLHLFLVVCIDTRFPANGDKVMEAFTYRVSADLIHWPRDQLLMPIVWIDKWRDSKVGSGVVAETYPSLLDETSAGDNFEFSGPSPYLYYTRFNAKTRANLGKQDRDILRLQLKVTCNE